MGQLFSYVNTAGFLLLPLECGKCNTGVLQDPSVPLAINVNRKREIRMEDGAIQILVGQNVTTRVFDLSDRAQKQIKDRTEETSSEKVN